MEIIDWSVKNSRYLAFESRSYIKKYNETVLKKATEKLLLNGILFADDILELERKEQMPLLSTLLPKGHGWLIDADETLATAWTNIKTDKEGERE